MDRAEIDENGKGKLFFGKSLVVRCSGVEKQKDVFLLETNVILERDSQLAPKAGQFYLLKSAKSSVQIDRPISVFRSEEVCDRVTGQRLVKLSFLILQKGAGTKELCTMLPGDEVEVIGPLGNAFEVPEGIGANEICIVGGGIGVAPVANFASTLENGSYDFYASFKSGCYGLDYVSAKNLVITTDDGTAGIKGMLPAALTEDVIREKGYKAIFACGPNPMLAYVQKVSEKCGIKCFLSMENRMLCGVGACLGCTVFTKDGVKRVCKDGPVFDGSIIEFAAPGKRRESLMPGKKPDMSVDIAGVHFENPVIAASGTFGFGQNYRGIFDVNRIGGISGKGCTLNPKDGNPGNRVIEVPSGNINSIGLQNPGVAAFIRDELPEMMKLKPVAIANLAGGDLESYVEGAKLLDASDVPMIELNISCPNVKAGGMAWGIMPEAAFECVSAVRKATKKPLMVKLSPNAPSVVAVALACIEAGADALSLINTVQAMAIDIEKGKPFFDNVRAGLCGPAIRPLALRICYDVVEAVNKLPEEKRVPIVGLGGISKWQDAVEFIMAGCSAIQVGSATFSNPNAMIEIIDGLEQFMISHGYSSLEEMRGIAQVNN